MKHIFSEIEDRLRDQGMHDFAAARLRDLKQQKQDLEDQITELQEEIQGRAKYFDQLRAELEQLKIHYPTAWADCQKEK